MAMTTDIYSDVEENEITMSAHAEAPPCVPFIEVSVSIYTSIYVNKGSTCLKMKDYACKKLYLSGDISI